MNYFVLSVLLHPHQCICSVLFQQISCENYEYSDDSNMVRFITDEDRGITNVEKFFGKGKKRQTKIIFFSDVILKFTGELKSNRGDHHRVGFWRAKCTTFQHGSLKER